MYVWVWRRVASSRSSSQILRYQSGTYRAVIDDVIANVRQDFEEMGIEKEVLEELQRVRLHTHNPLNYCTTELLAPFSSLPLQLIVLGSSFSSNRRHRLRRSSCPAQSTSSSSGEQWCKRWRGQEDRRRREAQARGSCRRGSFQWWSSRHSYFCCCWLICSRWRQRQ